MTCEKAREAIDATFKDHDGMSPEEHRRIAQAFSAACYQHVFMEQPMAGYVLNCSVCMGYMLSKGVVFRRPD